MLLPSNNHILTPNLINKRYRQNKINIYNKVILYFKKLHVDNKYQITENELLTIVQYFVNEQFIIWTEPGDNTNWWLDWMLDINEYGTNKNKFKRSKIYICVCQWFAKNDRAITIKPTFLKYVQRRGIRFSKTPILKTQINGVLHKIMMFFTMWQASIASKIRNQLAQFINDELKFVQIKNMPIYGKFFTELCKLTNDLDDKIWAFHNNNIFVNLFAPNNKEIHIILTCLLYISYTYIPNLHSRNMYSWYKMLCKDGIINHTNIINYDKKNNNWLYNKANIYLNYIIYIVKYKLIWLTETLDYNNIQKILMNSHECIITLDEEILPNTKLREKMMSKYDIMNIIEEGIITLKNKIPPLILNIYQITYELDAPAMSTIQQFISLITIYYNNNLIL